jgi:hypothetical protein
MRILHCRILGRRPTAVFGLLLVLIGYVLYRSWASVPDPVLPEGFSSSPSGDQRLRHLALGTWEDDYQGKRTMTLCEDGTGTMVVELSGLKATLFASKLTFEMEWSVQDGRMKKRTTGGEPAGRVKLILNMMGDRVDEPILELTEDRLVLLDKDGKTKYNWRRKQEKGLGIRD